MGLKMMFDLRIFWHVSGGSTSVDAEDMLLKLRATYPAWKNGQRVRWSIDPNSIGYPWHP